MNIIDRYISEYQAVIKGSIPIDEVRSLLDEYAVDNDLYAEWLSNTGGGPIGPDWYEGIEDLRESQEKVAKAGWDISGFVIGWDGSGNPIVLDANGSIYAPDHNFGGKHLIAVSFEALLNANICS